MCGIFGYYDQSGRSLDPGLIELMGESIAHRGPDDSGIHFGPGLALGNQRLSIIDVAGGHQPFVSDDGNVVVVQNGEIFNHIELATELAQDGYICRSHCDTEVILCLYLRDGIEMVQRLNGMFAIAVYDKRLDALYLVRDRVGVKPLYIHQQNGCLIFASEIKALIRAGISAQMNHRALHHFLTFNYVPAPLTMFQGVEHLAPGHWLRIDRDGVILKQWWDLATQEVETRSEADWIADFYEILDDAVRLRLRADVPFGAFLSGGVDSSSVVGLMTRHMSQPVKTFSIGFHEKRFDESPYSEEAAKRFGTDHTLERVDANMLDLWPLASWYCDQPHGDISFLPTYRVAELAAKHVKMVLTGDGADELFAGYDKYRDFFTGQGDDVADEQGFRRAYYRNLSLFDDAAKQHLYSDSLSDELAEVDAYDVVAPLFEKSAHMDRINQALYIDTMLLLSGNNLVKPDRMGMAVSLEARTPFLDYRMMEFAFRMPGELKLRDGVTKYLYKKAVCGLIGDGLAYRKKQMFTVPVGEWFRDRLAPFTEAVLLDERTVSRGLFRPDVVRGMLRAHQQGSANYTREIRALIAVELWARIFLDSEEPVVADLTSLGIASELVKAGG